MHGRKLPHFIENKRKYLFYFTTKEALSQVISTKNPVSRLSGKQGLGFFTVRLD